jgi:hypothetical protein
MDETDWPYAGSRWWKFDFHTHTPASTDARAWRDAIGTPEEVTPEKWLLKFMAAGVDCVAVTDHNSGAWIDRLKAAYMTMRQQAETEQAPAGFRKLTIFPGVEVSVSGGFHLLVIFDPAASTRTVTDLLATVGYHGTDGGSDGVARHGPVEVIRKVIEAGGIPIPAHADRPGDAGKALLALRDGTPGASRLDANTVRDVLDIDELLAVEWEDETRLAPECARARFQRLARVLGSDCHNFEGAGAPGSRYTWIKMARPSLEGLRLALLDGNGVSIRRSDDPEAFDPFKVPPHIITGIEIHRLRVMGHGRAARFECSPYFNAIVGGRGTGKSTVVHALRLGTRREQEVMALPEGSEPREEFTAFRRVSKGRDEKGALKPDTELRVEWRHEQVRLRLLWRADGQAAVEEWRAEGGWQPSVSQSVNAARFPIRIFSQGQIAELAGNGRQSLLAIIDEAAGVDALRQAFDEACRAYLAQRARLRELDGKLAAQPEADRRLHDAERKLAAFAHADHAVLLQAFSRAQHQQRELDGTLMQLGEAVSVLGEAAERIVLDDWPPQHFTEEEADLLAWREEAGRLAQQTQQRLAQEAAALKQRIETLARDGRVAAWRERAEAARVAHIELQARLAAQGVGDPQAFARLTQEKQQLESQLKLFQQMHADRLSLVRQIEAQHALVLERRQAITTRRQSFLGDTLAHNEHVHMAVIAFGFDPSRIERELRTLIDAMDDRFADDIRAVDEGGEATSGLALELARAVESSKLATLDGVKRKLLKEEGSLGGRLRNYLDRKLEKPEFADHIQTWFPEDDLRIEYQRGGKWTAISEGSQGQRSAALLAFLLAFGEEPIVLDQPEDDLDNHLIYDLIVRQIRENKQRRQLIVVTHNPNVVVNGDAELVHVMDFGQGQCYLMESGALQEKRVRDEVCRVMEGGRDAFERRWKRLGREV